MYGSQIDLRAQRSGTTPVPDSESKIHPGDLPHVSPRRRRYIALRAKLLIVVAAALGWAGFSLWISIPWMEALGHSITLPLAVAVILGIAIVPGYLNANLVASLLIDRPPALRFDLSHPDVTVVIACFNEEETIEETIDYAERQDYPGEMRILVADDGSTDRTAELARRRSAQSPHISVLRLPHRGKARTLTRALAEVTTPLVATVDADTLLMRSALKRLVARFLVSPPDTAAVAGAVFVRNSRRNLFTRAQEWDYFLGIASVKRQQGKRDDRGVARARSRLGLLPPGERTRGPRQPRQPRLPLR
jgi:poly-beta-1,6-N-acetyl-D-glucosamine synthase